MADLQELYQAIILDHNRRPKNYGALEGADHRAAGRNPDCGDEVTVELLMDGDRIADVRFTSAGCAVSRASASIMTQHVKGKSREEVERLFARFHELVGEFHVDPTLQRLVPWLAARREAGQGSRGPPKPKDLPRRHGGHGGGTEGKAF